MQARMKAETFFKERGKKTEDALHQVGESMKALFSGGTAADLMSGGRPWWGEGYGGPGGLGGIPQAAGTKAAGDAPGAPAAAVPTVATAVAPGQATAAAASVQQHHQALDDAAMRRHCAALERLVEMGVSPQAARVALRHLDSWIVGEDGEAEMAAAEGAAAAAGEPILHVGDRVRLEGLVKNSAVNGMVGTLLAYSADSIRWKVSLSDGQVFWVKPKLLKPLELRRRPLPHSGEPSAISIVSGGGAIAGGGANSTNGAAAAGEASSSTAQAAALAAGWAGLEARQAVWKEEQEAREILLLEREEALRKMQEAIEAERQELGDQAMAAKMSESQRASVSMSAIPTSSMAAAPSGASSSEGVAEKFAMVRQVSPEALRVEPSEDEGSVRELDASHADEGPGEEDEMWDMDWTTLSRSAGAPSSSSSPPAVATDFGDMEDSGRLLAKTSPTVVRFPEAEASETKFSPRTDWSSSSTGSCSAAGGSVASTATGGAGMLKVPKSSLPGGAVSGGKSGSPRSPRTSSPRAPAPGSVDSLGMPTPEKRALAQKLKEKRRLADEHNGEDHSSAPSREFDKGRMPGAHPLMAQKLEERRRKIEMEEQVQPVPA